MKEFWGASVANSPMEQARQIWLNAQAKMILSGEIKMAKTKRVHAKQIHTEGPEVGAIVDAAVERMAEEATSKILHPGLHVRRYRLAPEGKVFYSTVLVIGVDRGHGQVCKVYTIQEEGNVKLTKYEIETSDFQRIAE